MGYRDPCTMGLYGAAGQLHTYNPTDIDSVSCDNIHRLTGNPMPGFSAF